MNATSSQPLAGMHAVVTGAGRGIGRAIALHLARLGASLALLGRDEARLQAVAGQIEATRCTLHRCDVGDAAAVDAAFTAIGNEGPNLAILVNNAGVAKSAPLESTDAALWEQMLRLNLTGAYHCTRAALPALKRAPCARIVNVASTAGLTGYP